MSYLQRLILDKACGFNYDFMGYAEFEGGATLNGRTAMADGLVNKIMAAKELDVKFYNIMNTGERGYQKPVPCIVIATVTALAAVRDTIEVRWEKTGPRQENDRIVGWMTVWRDSHPEDTPMLILKKDVPDMQTRINQFFDPIMKDLIA